MVAVVLMAGTAEVGWAQQLGNPGGGAQSGESGGSSGTGHGAAGMGLGTGVGGGPAPGVGTSPGTAYGTGSAGAGPVLNDMRANGTALYMNPDPRAPNVSGRAAPLR